MNSPTEFLTYQPVPPEADVWGLAVVGAGRAVLAPGAGYPPSGHGEGHTFTWETGRVLGAYQLVLVAEGRGQFESQSAGMIEVEPGSVILLFPGKWHRYRPDPKTGWSEYWIEFVGPSVDRGGIAPTPLDASIARAERILVEHLSAPPPMPEVARLVGMAYSYFRREFKDRTGFSPHQYLQRLRLEKARRVMGTTAEPIKSIADRLGFSSPFHFSAAFKKEFGISPHHWRRAMNETREPDRS